MKTKISPKMFVYAFEKVVFLPGSGSRSVLENKPGSGSGSGSGLQQNLGSGSRSIKNKPRSATDYCGTAVRTVWCQKQHSVHMENFSIRINNNMYISVAVLILSFSI